MSSKRKSGGSSANLNFRPQTESNKSETQGTVPLPEPETVQDTLVTVMVQICRKILLIDPKLRVALYVAGIFLSFIFDVLQFPRSYFSRSDNLFNFYFVKMGWAWTLFATLPFVLLTSFTYCCGSRKMILMHLSRIVIASIVWYSSTRMFSYVERNYGKCSKGRDIYKTKSSCVSNGYCWYGFDISGHTFILMWSTLVIVEECQVLTGWEKVKDVLTTETQARSVKEVKLNSPINNLTEREFLIMRISYQNFAIYVKLLFIFMTMLVTVWDMMIISTIIYFHVMIEKLVAGLLAAGMWAFTYKFWYAKLNIPPYQPGYGLYKYTKYLNTQKEILLRINSSQNNGKKGSKFQDKDKSNKELNLTKISKLVKEEEKSRKIDKKKVSESLT